ncbi:MAG: hypothetical protein IPM72_11500 [Chitinophagaceae bacterium]|nr:hypothetical protein [Chitinophagaceae bacterium]
MSRLAKRFYSLEVEENSLINGGSNGIAGNEQGFVQAGHCCLSCPELKPNKEIKVQDNN